MQLSCLISIFISVISLCFSATNEYNPWYTGPLLTPSASCLSPGQANYQPYILVNDTHPLHSRAHHHPVVSDTTSINVVNYIQYGLFDSFDVTFLFQAVSNHRNNINTFSYGDTNINFGIQILREEKGTPIPSIRLCISETLPTGKYRNLNPEKAALDSSGSGSFATNISLNLQKVVYWNLNHPTRFRLAASVSLPSKVLVKNFNAYGGGYNTYGKVSPPVIFSPKFALECSLTQNWVLALDLLYSYSSGSSFKGIEGTKEDGTLASNESKSSHILSLAPAIEYNFSGNLGIITGFCFPIATKNSKDYLNYIFSLTYTF